MRWSIASVRTARRRLRRLAAERQRRQRTPCERLGREVPSVGSGVLCCRFFFFSSRRRHTRSDRDWSSDVCSSDLVLFPAAAGMDEAAATSNGGGKKKKQSPRQMAVSERTRINAHLMSLMQRGFTRLYKDGRTIELATPDSFTETDFEETFVLVDRLAVNPEARTRSEEHTSELQSRSDLVCRL